VTKERVIDQAGYFENGFLNTHPDLFLCHRVGDASAISQFFEPRR
jgi:hypothetical protein